MMTGLTINETNSHLFLLSKNNQIIIPSSVEFIDNGAFYKMSDEQINQTTIVFEKPSTEINISEEAFPFIKQSFIRTPIECYSDNDIGLITEVTLANNDGSLINPNEAKYHIYTKQKHTLKEKRRYTSLKNSEIIQHTKRILSILNNKKYLLNEYYQLYTYIQEDITFDFNGIFWEIKE